MGGEKETERKKERVADNDVKQHFHLMFIQILSFLYAATQNPLTWSSSIPPHTLLTNGLDSVYHCVCVCVCVTNVLDSLYHSRRNPSRLERVRMTYQSVWNAFNMQLGRAITYSLRCPQRKRFDFAKICHLHFVNLNDQLYVSVLHYHPYVVLSLVCLLSRARPTNLGMPAARKSLKGGEVWRLETAVSYSNFEDRDSVLLILHTTDYILHIAYYILHITYYILHTVCM